MSDLILAMAVMAGLSFASGILAALWLFPRRGQLVVLCVTIAVLGTVLFQFYASGQLFWAEYVPNSAALIYTNFASIFAAFAAGWAWRLANTPAWRRISMVIMLGAASLIAVGWPLISIALRPPPVGGDTWESQVAMQSSWATCSPAAAATLLHHEGVDVSEAEMIPLCLTDSSGTPTLGLYRGIKLMADRNAYRVSIVDRSLETLLDDDDWPVLLAVGLPFGVEDKRYQDQWGWIPGMGHSVVALGRTSEGYIIIGDPSVGLERWTQDDLKILWNGAGIRMHTDVSQQ